MVTHTLNESKCDLVKITICTFVQSKLLHFWSSSERLGNITNFTHKQIQNSLQTTAFIRYITEQKNYPEIVIRCFVQQNKLINGHNRTRIRHSRSMRLGKHQLRLHACAIGGFHGWQL